MASPELSSPVLAHLVPTPPQTQQHSAKRRHQPSSRLPRPIATSRGFHLHPPMNGKTDTIGFLHLPQHIRTRIYELAIYDHDRGAVFLPRTLPRKVEPDIDDVDIEYADDDITRDKLPELSSDSYKPIWCEPTLPGDSAASGRWIEDENVQEATFDSLELPLASVESMTDQDLLDALDANSEAGAEDERNYEVSIVSDSYQSVISLSSPFHFSELAHLSDSPEPKDLRLADCLCICHESESESTDEERDSKCGCGDADCHVCCDLPVHFTDDPRKLANAFGTMDYVDDEDQEHYVPQELVGMVYEPKEPAILLACKEIRQECSFIYFARNSFSWRFLWTDYLRSCLRFKSWLKSISPLSLQLMTEITFQGRHVIEEGAEFSIDIDFFDEHPFFETRVYAADADVDTDIADSIHRDMASYLWLMVQSVGKRPIFTVGHLCELASIFVQGMHRQVDKPMIPQDAG